MLSRVGKMLPGISGGGLFGAGYPGGQLLGDETAGLAIDFTAPNNWLLIRNTSALTNFVGNVFVNDGGPVSFSRASLGTVVDADGNVKWAAHNLLLASEQFDAANWTKTTTTVAANSVAAPNSTTTAETLTAGGANSTTLQSYSASDVAYTFGVWLKRKTGTGTIQIAADSGTWNTVTITADWALYTIAQTPAAGTISAGIRIVTSGDEVYAWGAHLYRSDLGGMQANASAYPMYNPTTPKNLLGFTETFSTGWTATNATRTASTEDNPNGLSVCSELTATAGNGTLLGLLSLLASPYTFSIWLKRKTGTGDIQITVDGSTYVTVAVTGSWQRFSTTLTPTAGARTPGIRIVTNGDAVFLWGAQLSNSASLDPYVPNQFAAPSAAAYYGPRLDYDPSTLAPKGLLIEEQRSNLLLNSATLSTQSITVTAIPYTLSFYGTGTVTLSGTSTAGPLVGTGAYPNRVTLTFTPTAGTLTLTVSGTVTQAQLEAGSFATSYIPTTTASATRSADTASVATSRFPYSASEGTLVSSIEWGGVTPSAITNTVGLGQSSGLTDGAYFLTTSNLLYATVRSGNSNSAFFSSGASPTGIRKMALATKVDDFALSVDGGSVLTDTSGPMPVGVTNLRMPMVPAGAYWIRQITYIPRRISNAELQQRTA